MDPEALAPHNAGGPGASPYAPFRRYLLKTGLRTMLWVVLAAVITLFFPSAQWVWYVVGAFVVIAILWAAMLGMLGYLAQRQVSSGDNNGEG